MEHIPRCIICGGEGSWFHRDLEDSFYGIPGRYHLRKCEGCDLSWLDPRPDIRSISACYANYYTHIFEPPVNGSSCRRRFSRLRDAMRLAILQGHFGYPSARRDGRRRRLGTMLASVPFLRYRAAYDDLAERFPVYSDRPDNLLIDVGCGRGDFLARMKSMGWNVLGVEPDPVSAAIARSRSIPVFNGSLEKAGLADGIADEVCLNHVLEHVHAPLALLCECYRILRPGGRLVLYLPNINGLGHRFFGRHWAGLDPPRHLFHFSPGSISLLLGQSPFRQYRTRTVGKISRGIYDTSRAIREGTLTQGAEADRRRGREAFRMAEAILCRLGLDCGEEIEVIAFK
jgi:SAM-dependent methyltransferase